MFTGINSVILSFLQVFVLQGAPVSAFVDGWGFGSHYPLEDKSHNWKRGLYSGIGIFFVMMAWSIIQEFFKMQRENRSGFRQDYDLLADATSALLPQYSALDLRLYEAEKERDRLQAQLEQSAEDQRRAVEACDQQWQDKLHAQLEQSAEDRRRAVEACRRQERDRLRAQLEKSAEDRRRAVEACDRQWRDKLYAQLEKSMEDQRRAVEACEQFHNRRFDRIMDWAQKERENALDMLQKERDYAMKLREKTWNMIDNEVRSRRQ